MSTTDDELIAEQIDNLGNILAGIPDEKRTIMLAWAAREMKTRPILAMCSARFFDDEGIPGKRPPGPQTVSWEVGKYSPTYGKATIFALLLDDGPEGKGPQSKVLAYSFEAVEQGGRTGVLLYKETIYRPDHTGGPLSGEAIFRDWFDFFATDEEREMAHLAPEPEGEHATNGAS